MRRPDWSRSQWVLRAVVALGPVVALLVGGGAQLWLIAVVAVLGVGWAVVPESVAGTVVVLVVAVRWVVGVDDPLGPRLMVATGALLLAHLGATVAALGPGRLDLDRATLRRWGVRALGLLAAPLLPLGMLLVIAGEPVPAGVWVVAVVVLLVGLVGAAAAVRPEAS